MVASIEAQNRRGNILHIRSAVLAAPPWSLRHIAAVAFHVDLRSWSLVLRVVTLPRATVTLSCVEVAGAGRDLHLSAAEEDPERH